MILYTFVYNNDYNSDLMPINCGVPHDSAIWLLLFLIYINDLQKAIQHYKKHHSTDDTKLSHRTI